MLSEAAWSDGRQKFLFSCKPFLIFKMPVTGQKRKKQAAASE